MRCARCPGGPFSAPAHQASKQGYTSIYAVEHCEVLELNVMCKNHLSRNTIVQLMSSCRKLEKAVAVPGSFLEKLSRKSQQSGRIPPGFLFLPGLGHFFSGMAMVCRKIGPEFGNAFSLKTATAVFFSSSDYLCVFPECSNFASVSLAGSLH